MRNCKIKSPWNAKSFSALSGGHEPEGRQMEPAWERPDTDPDTASGACSGLSPLSKTLLKMKNWQDAAGEGTPVKDLFI